MSITTNQLVSGISGLTDQQRAALSGSITLLHYTNGQVVSIDGVGWTGSITYDILGRAETYTDETGTVRTITYNGDGTVANYL